MGTSSWKGVLWLSPLEGNDGDFWELTPPAERTTPFQLNPQLREDVILVVQ